MRYAIPVLFALAFGGASFAGDSIPTVVYSGRPTSSTSEVPGLPGTKFTIFRYIVRSPDESKWILTADTNFSGGQDVLLVGSVADASASLVVHQNHTTLVGTNLAGGLRGNRPDINNAGQYIFKTNHDGSTSSDDVIVLWDGSAFSYPYHEGMNLPAPNALQKYSATINSINLWDDGSIAFHAPNTTGSLPADLNDFLIFDGALIDQEGTTVPANQAGGTSRPWDFFGWGGSLEDFYSNDAGQYLVLGNIEGASVSGPVLVYNGNVVLQRNSMVLGTSTAIQFLGRPVLNSNGDWYAYCGETNARYFLRNGIVLAESEDSVPGGMPGETLLEHPDADTFFAMAGNHKGDYVYGAATSLTTDPFEPHMVLIYNNEMVLARTGDPVDVDGNGLADDDAYITGFAHNNTTFLTETECWSVIGLVNGAGGDLRFAIIRIPIPGPACAADLTGGPGGSPDGNVNVADLFYLLANWNTNGPGAELAPPNNIVDVADLFILLSAWGSCI